MEKQVECPIRVGFIGRPGGFGGIDRYVNELYRELRKKGVDIQIVWTGEPRAPFQKTLHSFFFLPPKVLKDSRRFDLIHASQPMFCQAFPFLPKPKVVTFFDLIPILGRRWVSMKEHLRLFNFAVFSTWMIFAKFSDKIITISTQTFEELREFGFPEEKLRVIPIGVSDKFVKLDMEKGEKKIIGYLGPVTYRKGVDFVIKSFSHLVRKHEIDAELWICGKWEKEYEYKHLVDLAKTLGVEDRVKFKGFIPQEKIVETYNRFDVFLFGSVYEGFGLPILEAQRCGVPVVIRKDARIPAEVSKCCVKAISPEDMAEKTFELLTNEGLRKKISKQGIEYASGFTWERTAEETVKVYEELH